MADTNTPRPTLSELTMGLAQARTYDRPDLAARFAAAIARRKAEEAAALSAYWGNSIGASVDEDVRAGRVVTIHAE